LLAIAAVQARMATTGSRHLNQLEGFAHQEIERGWPEAHRIDRSRHRRLCGLK
jgi:hypothetical protein